MPHDGRVPVHAEGMALVALSYEALGIIYADLGTSPLYVLNGIWPADGPVPPEEDVIGGVSAIIWAIIILPLIKYVFICPPFGTAEGPSMSRYSREWCITSHIGEGGTFALYQGLFPPKHIDADSDRALTTYETTGTSDLKASRKSTISPKLRWPLMIWALFGTSLTLADGIFTPAVSVTSAVAGIAIAKPSVSGDVIPISIAFLVALFLVQFKGTHALAFIFSPVMIAWFGLIAATGIVNIVSFPGILRAFDPSRAVLLFVRTKNYDLLAGILLALTGAEAMFANLGQFNSRSIQISFGTIVFPSIILAYLGQGARLIVDGDEALPNLFYKTIPGSSNGPLFWVLYVVAILATLIASQSLITATFSFMQQLVNMRVLPSLALRYTNDNMQGQVYVPFANWVLMILTIVVVAAFKSSVALTNAFGFSVATVMFSTTILISVHIVYVKQLPWFVALGFFLMFGFFDGLFWGAALKKVPHGAWVPLMIGLILMAFMTFWTWGRELEDDFDNHNRRNLRDIIIKRDIQHPGQPASSFQYSIGPTSLPESSMTSQDGEQRMDEMYYVVDRRASLDEEKGALRPEDMKLKALARIPTCAVFHKLTPGQGVPHSFVGFFRQWPALPRVVIFLSTTKLPVARVPPEERYSVTKVRTLQGFYGVSYYVGFRDEFDVKVAIKLDCLPISTANSLSDFQIADIINIICNIEERLHPESEESAPIIRDIKLAAESSTHIVPHYVVSSRKTETGRFSTAVNFIRKMLIEEGYRRISTMFPETANWVNSADEIIHVGINASI
ncbi:hypothetical protein QCA50_011206 [Cerrena zonata]|uniref:Potassium transporter n=1 Tax=Cerrena zonata TaxID=2478898 RepID=A0AAW0G2F9_9APHY